MAEHRFKGSNVRPACALHHYTPQRVDCPGYMIVIVKGRHGVRNAVSSEEPTTQPSRLKTLHYHWAQSTHKLR